MEAYIVDDLKEITNNDKGQEIAGTTFVVFDIETTGFSPVHNKIIEIGAVKVKDGRITDRFPHSLTRRFPFLSPLKS